MTSSIVKKNIDINIFVYADSTCNVFMENPINGPSDTYLKTKATSEDVVEQWIMWLDVLETSKKVPTLREQLDNIFITYQLTKDY